MQRIRVLQVSFLAIFSAFLVELVLGITSNSLALITDSMHALLDAMVTVVLLLAATFALRPPDAEHTYGHGKIESLGGMLGGVAIFAVACFFIYESASRLQQPPPDVLPGLAAIAAGAYVICVDVFRVVILKRSLGEGGVTVKADMYHALMDMGSTGVAIGGVVLASYGLYHGDFAAALVLGCLLIALSVKLVYKTAMELTDVIAPDIVRDVRRISLETEGVMSVGPVLMRRSGQSMFADVTVSLRGDTSFENAHRTSSMVESNIMDKIPNADVTVHFEPDWNGVPPDSKIQDAAMSVNGVMSVHNISTHKINGKMSADLHVMVSREIDLRRAHRISERVEENVCRTVPDVEHATIHLEPFVEVPKESDQQDGTTEAVIRAVLQRYDEVRGVGRIESWKFGSITKIEIDCSFDGDASIEEVHDLTSDIEQTIRGEIKNSVITIHPEPY